MDGCESRDRWRGCSGAITQHHVIYIWAISERRRKWRAQARRPVGDGGDGGCRNRVGERQSAHGRKQTGLESGLRSSRERAQTKMERDGPHLPGSS